MPRGMKKGLTHKSFMVVLVKCKADQEKKVNPYAVGHKIIESQKITRIDSRKLSFSY